MSASTTIGWTDATWNPWMGCTKVSPGCAHCYAERDHIRYNRPPFEIVRRSKTTFDAPLRWRDPRRIFTCSWSDWFHEAADAWRPEAWDIIRRTRQHTYQILTKRPELIPDRLPDDWGDGYPNVWLGVSVESQRFDYRATLLCQHPAAVRFISAEPLIGPLYLTNVNPFAEGPKRSNARRDDLFVGINVLEWPRHPPVTFQPGQRIGRIDWVIAGGESGADWRHMHPVWAAELRDECHQYGVPFFMKQGSGALPERQYDLPDDLWACKQVPEVTA